MTQSVLYRVLLNQKNSQMKLQNKIAVITGAGKGIGRAAAKLFLKEGASVVLNSRTKSDLDSFIKEHQDYKDKILTIAGDVSDEKIIEQIVKETIGKFSRIDILVNNAGFGKFAEMVNSTIKDFDDMFNTNVRALYILTRDFLPYMIKQKEGIIVNIASIAGKNGVPAASIYSATKHAVMGLSRSLMLEVRKHGIRVVAICPGSVTTGFFRESPSELAPNTMLKSEDIAETILYAAALPLNATVNEIEIRPANPAKN
jgi:3-oxoacyl-[acyl-carrier protein] reductase